MLVLLTFSLRLFWIKDTIIEGDMIRDFQISDGILKGDVRYTGIGALEQGVHQQSFGPIMYYLITILLYLFKQF